MSPVLASWYAYAQLMGTEDFDVVLLGLGQNAHLAFNDPPAHFEHPQAAPVVALDELSRQQQVDEGHFPDLAAVPTHAVTVTIPRLLATRHIIASVPGPAKRWAVTATVRSEPDPNVPGTARCRQSPRCSRSRSGPTDWYTSSARADTPTWPPRRSSSGQVV
ncbi:6-phosphogluconolactonase [Ruania albidiflava]|uniref:6-phosphogluconolactonase n=1 Tax=Ruania albidiflava TaxID=366586 RepID=UPI0023F4419D|nr:6-phosphogluconolactonase [Ruania albidiflava]